MNQNEIFDAPQAPYVGMPATYRIGSDKYAGKLIKVSRTGHQVTWMRVNDFTGQPAKNFTHRFSRRENGAYITVGSKYGDLVLGVAKTDLDEGF